MFWNNDLKSNSIRLFAKDLTTFYSNILLNLFLSIILTSSFGIINPASFSFIVRKPELNENISKLLIAFFHKNVE